MTSQNNDSPNFRCEIQTDPYGVSHKVGKLDDCFNFIAENEQIISHVKIDKIKPRRRS